MNGRVYRSDGGIFLKYKIPRELDTRVKFENYFYHNLLWKFVRYVYGSNFSVQIWLVPFYVGECGDIERICQHCVSSRVVICPKLDEHQIRLRIASAFQRLFNKLNDHNISGYKKMYFSIY